MLKLITDNMICPQCKQRIFYGTTWKVREVDYPWIIHQCLKCGSRWDGRLDRATTIE